MVWTLPLSLNRCCSHYCRSKGNDEQANNDDSKGERSFINIGNVNGANSNDWTDNSVTNAIIDEMVQNDDALAATAFTAGADALQDDYVIDSGTTYKAKGCKSMDTLTLLLVMLLEVVHI